MIPEKLKYCLSKIEKPTKYGERCDHGPSTGQWIVKDDDGTIYFINPSTQMQKNLWMDSAINLGYISKDDVERFRQHLKWLCHDCGTIQEA